MNIRIFTVVLLVLTSFGCATARGGANVYILNKIEQPEKPDENQSTAPRDEKRHPRASNEGHGTRG